jgi:cyclic pyranopterin phosphate synthase
VLLADDIIATLSREISSLIEIPHRDRRAPATEYQFADGIGRIGIVASVSRPFCLNCNRIRLTSDGKIRYCLFAVEETDVKGLLRSGAPDQAIAAAIRGNVLQKWMGHEINTQRFVPPPRPMYSIGG